MSVRVNSTGGLLSFADEFVDVELQNYRCGWSCDARLGIDSVVLARKWVYLAYGVNRFDTRSVRRLFEFPKCKRLLG